METGLREADRNGLLAIENRLLPLLARVIVTSATTGERLAADFGVEAARIRVVVPGTDDAPRSVGSGGPTCGIISVGTLVPRKGHDVLLRALARLFDLDWRLTIVGSLERDPVHARALRSACAEEFGIDARVRFAGEVTDAELEELWRGADMFALATHWEGYGMAVAEALKRGLPVAVGRAGRPACSVTPEAGVVCRPVMHINLSKALRRLIFDADAASRRWQKRAFRVGQKPAELGDAGEGICSGPGRVTKHFDADWLALREPFDHAARSVALARRLADRIPRRPRLLDLGAGTGSLFRFLAPIIGRGQDWIVIDARRRFAGRGLRSRLPHGRDGRASLRPLRMTRCLSLRRAGCGAMQAMQRDLTVVNAHFSGQCCFLMPMLSSAARCSTWFPRRGLHGCSTRCMSRFRQPDGGWPRCLAAASSRGRTRAFGVPTRSAVTTRVLDRHSAWRHHLWR